MLRMLIMQFAFAFISNFKMFKPRTKAFFIGCVCAFFLYNDMQSFMNQRTPNLYNLVGFDRNSDAAFIEERLALAKTCDLEVTEEACSMFDFKNDIRLNSTEIEQIRYVFVKKPALRELYDKTEIFIRKHLEKGIHNPS